jgi:putative colanic acid biosynthesis glycosyltransferase
MHSSDQPSFSVVTVVLRDLEGLKRTYASLASQHCTSWEWIVCDGGSGSETIQFLQALDGPVHWVSQKDAGIYDAMNKGVAMSHNEYVVFMNAGDTFTDAEVLQHVSRKIVGSTSRPDIIFGAANIMFANGRTYLRKPKPIGKYIWHGLPANHQATYYRRESLSASPYDLTYKICGDYFLVATLFSRNIVAQYSDKPLANFYAGGSSFKEDRRLFLEPYRVQRDILNIPLWIRCVSLLKRLASTVGTRLIGKLHP